MSTTSPTARLRTRAIDALDVRVALHLRCFGRRGRQMNCGGVAIILRSQRGPAYRPEQLLWSRAISCTKFARIARLSYFRALAPSTRDPMQTSDAFFRPRIPRELSE